MNYPEIIVFDFGNTLATQVECSDIEKGNEKVVSLAKTNKNNITGKELTLLAQKINDAAYSMTANGNIEINGTAFSRLLYAVAGLSFDIDIEDVERQFFDVALKFEPIGGASALLEYLETNNIKYGVLSNTIWSEKFLMNYLSKLFPKAKFEFVMTSRDYLVCKPEKHLFEAMINIAGIPKDKIWFCGDLVHRDIEGAYQAGINPILVDYYGNYNSTGKYAQYQVPTYATKIANLCEIIDLIKDIKQIDC